MGTFLIVAALLALIIWGLGRWRKREIEKFRQTDVAMLGELKREVGLEDNEVGLAENPIQAAPVEQALSQSNFTAASELKPVMLQERHRTILQALDTILSPHYRVFLNLPMSDVFKTSHSQAVSFVICDRQYLALEVVMEFTDLISESLDSSLSTAGKPLIKIREGMSAEQLRRLLADTSKALVQNQPTCPKCDSEMRQRKPITGKNAGKVIWVCERFPSCRGAVSG